MGGRASVVLVVGSAAGMLGLWWVGGPVAWGAWAVLAATFSCGLLSLRARRWARPARRRPIREVLR
jgi:hypothetical protein